MKTKNKNITNENVLEQATSVEFFMLPPEFRRRSEFFQRFRMLLIYVVYSVSLGLGVYSILGGIKTNFNIFTNSQSFVFISIMIFLIMIPYVAFAYLMWSKSREYVFTWVETVIFLVSPAISIAGNIYIGTQSGDISRLIFLSAIICVASGATSPLLMFGLNILRKKAYHESVNRSIFALPGVLLSSSTIFILWILTKNNNFLKFDLINEIVIPFSIFFGGIMIMAIGISLSYKYGINNKNNVWYSIRYNSGIHAIILYTTLISVAAGFAINATFVRPIILFLVINVVLLFLLALFLFFRARIKNIHKTNPLYNEIGVKLYISIILITLFIFIYILPSRINVKSFAPYSYALVAIGAGAIIIGLIISNFMNLITYTKYRGVSFASTLFTTLIIISITLAIASLKQSDIMANIMGRQISILFIVSAMIFQLLSLFINIFYVFWTTFIRAKKVKIIDKIDNKKIIMAKEVVEEEAADEEEGDV